ncbi:uncharacterized protein [Spinacia oleracea]|uniref:RNase H type-1 domain-containing protein n=1 Tax=Spinacia oleracea TaxID=3562 RepID=A0A9R0JGD6_SPIOL|nr:uncharacterized protein LOC110805699 [Spinacia oleracea]
MDDFHETWVEIWGMEVSPKVPHFLWRMCNGTLPTRALLRSRHMLDDSNCPWGCGASETTAHALLECPQVQELWQDVGCGELVRAAGGVLLLEWVVSWKEVTLNLKHRAAYMAWCVWIDRNKKVYEDKMNPNTMLVARVEMLVEEFGKYSASIYGKPKARKGSSPKIWRAPAHGVIKINADASLADEGWIGMGMVARNHEGRVLFAACRRVRATWPVEIVEGKVLAMAIKLGKRYGYKNIILESDSQVVISRLSKVAVYHSDLDSVLEDILSLSSFFDSISWSHVKRDGNTVAHHLAKLVPFGIEQVWENHCPTEISPYVLMDTLSLD